MIRIELPLREAIQTGLRTLYGKKIALQTINLQPTRKEFEGDYTWVTFPFTELCNRTAPSLGEEVGAWLSKNSFIIKSHNTIKGFLNLSLVDSIWLDCANYLYKSPSIVDPAPNGKKIVVEFSSPNTNKPLHLGHLRNNFLGESITNILRAVGCDVYKVQIINDRGIHICKSMVAYQRWGNGETPTSTGIKGDHLVGKYYVQFDRAYKAEVAMLIQDGKDPDQAAQEAPLFQAAKKMLQEWEAGDLEILDLWKQMNQWVYAGFNETYKKIGVAFDRTYYESDTYIHGKAILQEGLAAGVFCQAADGSVWIDLQAEGLDKKLLLRSDGTTVYITQDLGTADLRYHDFKADEFIYVVGNEQDYHFMVLKKIMQRLQRPYANQLHHLSYGMVDLPNGKMKSREGTVVDADNLIEEMINIAASHTQQLGKIDGLTASEAEQLYYTLAMGALKYFLLRVDAKKRLLFDPQASIDFQGDTGPFIQYTHARIKTLLKKATERQLFPTAASVDVALPLHPLERTLIIQLSHIPDALQEAATTYSPDILAQQGLEIAKAYNRLYAELPILHESHSGLRDNRLLLSALTARALAWLMGLLGIPMPERM